MTASPTYAKKVRWFDVQRRNDACTLVARAPRLDALVGDLVDAFSLDFGTPCNQDCGYCSIEKYPVHTVSEGDMLKVAATGVSLGLRRATLIGGEPTIHKSLFDRLRKFRAIGVEEFVLCTNGLMLSYPDFLARLVEHPVTVLGLSVDDFREEGQNALTRNPNNFRLLMQALENLGRGPLPFRHIYFYSVLTRANPDVRGYLEFYERHPVGAPRTYLFSRLKPVANAWRNRADLHVSPEALVPHIAAGIDWAEAHGASVGLRNFPRCMLGERYERYDLDRYAWEMSYDVEARRYVRDQQSTEHMDFADRCRPCPWASDCHGLFKNEL